MATLMRVICNNWPLKLAALALGLTIWLFVLVNTNPWTVREVEATVTARGVPEGLQVMSMAPSTVRVQLAGRRRNVEDVHASNCEAWVHMAGKLVGEHVVEVVVSTGSLPKGVKPWQDPDLAVLVTLDETVSQMRPVKLSRRGEPAPEYKIIRTDGRPNQVAVSGPQRVVGRVDRVVAEFFVAGTTETRKYTCTLEARDANDVPVEGVVMSPAQAEVTLNVERRTSKQVPVLVGDSLSIPEGYEIQSIGVDPMVVLITAAPAVLDEIESVTIEQIDIPADATVVGVQFDLPDGVAVFGHDSVKITLELAAMRRLTPHETPDEPSPPPRPPPDETPDEPEAGEVDPVPVPQPLPEGDSAPSPTPEQPGEPGTGDPTETDDPASG